MGLLWFRGRGAEVQMEQGRGARTFGQCREVKEWGQVWKDTGGLKSARIQAGEVLEIQ